MLGEKPYQNQTEEFIHRTAEVLRPLYVSDKIVSQVEMTGCTIEGVRYFQELFEIGEDLSQEARLASMYVGCTAHGQKEMASQALDLLVEKVGYTRELERDLVNRLGLAYRAERQAKHAVRAQHLRIASKELGKTQPTSYVGEVATALTVVSDHVAQVA